MREHEEGLFYLYFLGRSSKAIQSTLWPGSQWRLGCSSEDGAWHGKLPSLGCGCPSPQGWMGCQHGEHRRCEAVNWRCGLLWFACLCCLWSKCVWLFCLLFPYSLCKLAGTIRKIFIWSRKANLMHWFVQPSGGWDSGHGAPWHHSGWNELGGNMGNMVELFSHDFNQHQCVLLALDADVWGVCRMIW